SDLLEQLARPRVARMAFEPRIVDASDGSMTREKPCDLQRALVLIAHPQGQRFQPAAEEKCRVRIHRAAQMIELVPDALDHFAAPGDGAGDDVRMAVQIFRRAV